MEENKAVPATTPDTQENLQNEPAENEPQAVNVNEQKDFKVPVKYNKENYELTLEQAATLAQKGMKFDSMQETLDKLNYLSAVNGMSVEKLVDKALSDSEEKLEKNLRELSGDDEQLFSKLLALEHSKNQKQFDRVINGKENLEKQEQAKENNALAEQFLELKREVPELIGINDVPQEVLKTAKEQGLCLLDAYLRYKHSENKKIAAAQNDSAAAQNNSVGPMSSDYTAADNLHNAFARGVWR